jgi:hypothetical protein
MWQNWVDIVLGIWLILSGLSFPLVTEGNLVITGVLIFIIGLLTLRYFNGMIMVVLGFWMVISGLIISLATPANFIVNGALILLFALWVASARRENTLTY